MLKKANKMIFEYLKSLGKFITGTRDQVDKSTEVLDDFLEKEYIYNAGKKLKELSGEIAKNTGKISQKIEEGIEKVGEELKNSEVTQRVKEVIKDPSISKISKEFGELSDDLTAKSREVAEELGKKISDFSEKIMEEE